jgi:hypothetical protein
MKMLNVLRTLGRYALEVLALLVFLVAVAILGAAMFAPRALAAGTNANLTWTNPSTYTDESPLPASEIREILIEWRRTAAGPVVGSVRVAGAPQSHTVPGLACGDFVFTVSVVTTASARYPSTTSDPSSPPSAYATGIACRPKAATGVTAN